MNQRPTAPAAQAARPAARPAAPVAQRPAAPAARPAAPAAQVARPAAPVAQRQAAPVAQRPAAPAAPVTRPAAPVAQRPVQRPAPVQPAFDPQGFDDTAAGGFGEMPEFDLEQQQQALEPGDFGEAGFDPNEGFGGPDGVVDGEGTPGFSDDLAGFAEAGEFPTDGDGDIGGEAQEYVPPVGAGEYMLKAAAPYATFLVGEDGAWYAGDEGVTTNTKVVKVNIDPDWLQPVVNKLGENWVVVDCKFLGGAVVVPVTSLLNLDKTPVEVAAPAEELMDEAQQYEELPPEQDLQGEAQAAYTQEQLDAVNAAYVALDNIRALFGMP